MNKRPRSQSIIPIIVTVIGVCAVIGAAVGIVYTVRSMNADRLVGMIEERYRAGDLHTASLSAAAGVFQYPGDARFLEWTARCDGESVAREESLRMELDDFVRGHNENDLREQIRALRALVVRSGSGAADRATEARLDELARKIDRIADEDIETLGKKIDELYRSVSLLRSLPSVSQGTNGKGNSSAVERDPEVEYRTSETIAALVVEAAEAFYAGRSDDVRITCRKIFQLDARNAAANLFYGAVMFDRSPGDTAARRKVIEHMKTALERDPKLTLAHFYLGQAYEIDGLYAAATREFRAYTAKERGNHEAYFCLGRCLFWTENFTDAIASFNTALGIRPNHAESLFYLARCRERTGSGDEALRDIERAIEAAPRDQQVVLAGASMYEKREAWDRAVILYGRAFDLNPRAFISFRAGMCAKNGKQWDAAADWFSRTISLDTRSWDAYFELGLAYAEKGNYAGAREVSLRLLEKNPGYEKQADVNALLDRLPKN